MPEILALNGQRQKDQHGLHSELQASMGYMERRCLKKGREMHRLTLSFLLQQIYQKKKTFNTPGMYTQKTRYVSCSGYCKNVIILVWREKLIRNRFSLFSLKLLFLKEILHNGAEISAYWFFWSCSQPLQLRGMGGSFNHSLFWKPWWKMPIDSPPCFLFSSTSSGAARMLQHHKLRTAHSNFLRSLYRAGPYGM